jgi:hypothetical protein
MTRSKDTLAVALTLAQIEYLRELLANDIGVWSDIVDVDGEEADHGMIALANATIAALDAPLPVYQKEAVAA